MLKKFFNRYGERADEGSTQDADEALPSIVFNDGGQERVLFTLPPTNRPDLPSSLVFAMPKSGSVLLDGIMRKLSDHLGVTYVSIMQEYFRIGLPPDDMPSETSKIFLAKGYCYGGFRHLPRRFEIPILGNVRTVLLVRDPRDMLVSHYFSMRESHPEPGKGLKSTKGDMSLRDLARAMSIDDYVKGEPAEIFRTFMRRYRENVCAGDSALKVYRYEDVIYEKPEWVADLAVHLGWDVPRNVTNAIAVEHDVIPHQEVETKHIRQVHPGNYRKKLRPETISWLNEYFYQDMSFFGYVADASASSLVAAHSSRGVV